MNSIQDKHWLDGRQESVGCGVWVWVEHHGQKLMTICDMKHGNKFTGSRSRGMNFRSLNIIFQGRSTGTWANTENYY